MSDRITPRVPSEPLVMVKPAVQTPSPSVEAAMVRKVERGMSTAMVAILLQSPSGQFWRVTVTDQGNLAVQAVQRS